MRPRHSITETEPVQEALDPLRAELGDRRVDFAELVVLGAREKTRQLQLSTPAARRARARLAERIITGETLIDKDAAAAAKQHGLIV